ncbi:hypothetical protein BDV93DRAFT_524270 [Ceratobasidium sp. AG-I]|nr:hypothetical protein BDV93DRAFT_524270 [Ceratobasidium sp. AG-I]
MSNLTEGIYAIQQVPRDKPLSVRFATSEDVNKPIKLEPQAGSFVENQLWRFKKDDDNWLIFTSSSPLISVPHGGHGPVVFGFCNDVVTDGKPVTLGAPTPFLLTPPQSGQENEFIIKPTNPPDEYGVEYVVGVDGEQVTIKRVAVSDNAFIPSWVLTKVDTE